MTMKDQDENKRQREPAFAKQALTKDGLVACYGAHLDDEHLSEGDKEAFLLALWQIMQGFVDLGFSVKAVSYTHLTLPTILRVSISGVPRSLKKKKKLHNSI